VGYSTQLRVRPCRDFFAHQQANRARPANRWCGVRAPIVSQPCHTLFAETLAIPLKNLPPPGRSQRAQKRCRLVGDFLSNSDWRKSRTPTSGCIYPDLPAVFCCPAPGVTGVANLDQLSINPVARSPSMDALQPRTPASVPPIALAHGGDTDLAKVSALMNPNYPICPSRSLCAIDATPDCCGTLCCCIWHSSKPVNPEYEALSSYPSLSTTSKKSVRWTASAWGSRPPDIVDFWR